jgi:hypothetical protein
MATYTEATTGNELTSTGTDTATPHTSTPTPTDALATGTDTESTHTNAPQESDAYALSSDTEASHTNDASEPDAYSRGVIIPGAFYQVDVTVYGSDGNRMKNALYVGNLGVFPTLAKVGDDGTATLSLLGTVYEEFIVFAESGNKGVDYAWYSTDESTRINAVEDRTGDIYVKETPIESGGGLSIATGVNLG